MKKNDLKAKWQKSGQQRVTDVSISLYNKKIDITICIAHILMLVIVLKITNDTKA